MARALLPEMRSRPSWPPGACASTPVSGPHPAAAHQQRWWCG
jgi:hypothetical protein